MSKFSIRLKEAMNRANISSSQLANKLGINRGIISNYINDKYKPKQDRLYDIANILGVNVAWLMGYDISNDKISIIELKTTIIDLVNNSQLNDIDKKKLINEVEYICR